MTLAPMSNKVHRAIDDALRLVGHTPDRYDADAIYGYFIEAGIHVMNTDEVTSRIFDDRCDFECHICHPADEEDCVS